jgi:glycosyltransferase involved in cell wall biosynthesis
MKILFILSDESGCAMYRALLPRYFLRLLPEVSEVKAVGQVSRLDVKLADVIVFQRIHMKEHEGIFHWAREEKKKLVYEIDDSVWSIPTWNPAYLVWNEEMQKQVSHFVSLCDAASCTTQNLAEELRQWNKTVFVLPNSLNLDMWRELKFNVPKSVHNELRIGWGGSPTHKGDLMVISRVLVDIAWKYRAKNLKYYFLGYAPPELIESLSGFVAFSKGVDIRIFPDKLHMLNLDIGLAPLVDCKFNRAKSNIKWLEYSALNVPVVASNVGPYKDSIVHGETGLLSENTYESWFNNLSRIIEDSSLRVSLARKANQIVYRDYDSRKNAKLWYDAFCSLFSEEELRAIRTRSSEKTPAVVSHEVDSSADSNVIRTERKREDAF